MGKETTDWLGMVTDGVGRGASVAGSVASKGWEHSRGIVREFLEREVLARILQKARELKANRPSRARMKKSRK